MTTICKLCGRVINGNSGNITHDICAECISNTSSASDYARLIEAVDAPILLMQGNPRQVMSANAKALKVFAKPMQQVADMRGGQVFDCVHSFTEAGCGKDINCEHCAIKNAIVDTFVTGNAHAGVSAPLQVKKADGMKNYTVQVSTEKAGDLALVRIDRYDDQDRLA